MGERKTVRVTIFNQQYSLAATDEEGEVESLAHSIDELALRFVAIRAAEPQFEVRQRGRFDPTVGQIKPVADIGHAQLAQIAEALAQGQQIGQQLARMQEVGESIDHRHAGFQSQFDANLMGESANHDEVDPARQIARHVLDRFALADPDILRGEIDGVATKLRHPGLEGYARPQRGLLEDHRERAAAQVRML